MVMLSVNLNKVALLRNARRGTTPSVLQAAAICLAEGAGGVTVHPRPDGRHTRESDVFDHCAHVLALDPASRRR
jgi:pyridoxine 5-phosphate synthase